MVKAPQTKKTKPESNDRIRQRLKKKHRREIRQVFSNAGFTLIPQEDIDVEIGEHKSDFDNIFIYDNLIIVTEDTTIETGKSDHLRKKAEFAKHCAENKSKVIEFLKINVPAFKNSKIAKCIDADIHIAFLYASLKEVDSQHQKRYRSTLIFMDNKILQYFLSLSKAIKKSSRFELFKFLDIDFAKIGISKSASTSNKYTGLILPEVPSGFPAGYFLISFQMDPTTLLRQSYVLRKDGWLDKEFLYQRILINSKIQNMRKYLTEKGRVFVNNVIVSLPKDAQFYNNETQEELLPPISTSLVKLPIQVSIPQQAGNIGIIDGQHRVFSYHEGDDSYEKIIGEMRDKQHLLVTGIVFPKNLSDDERMGFEAQLFLEINDKQTRTNAALRQVIGAIVDPFSEISIARMVVNELAQRDTMKDVLEQHFFDKGKLKTSSIVSYGMKHVVKLSGNDSFFHIWNHPKKLSFSKEKDRNVLMQYVKFCTDEMNTLLQAFEKNTPRPLWTTDRKISRVLTATTITGLIHCMRILIENDKHGDLDHYDRGFKKLFAKIDFGPKFPYKSSHWKSLGDRIYEICFK